MSPKELALGSMSLYHRMIPLTISSHSTIRFSSSSALHGFQSTLLSTTFWSSLERFWICRGQGLKLKFHISLDGHPLPDSELNELGNIICNCELWDQLCLRPDLSLQHQEEEGDCCMHGTLSLEIAHDRISVPMPKHSASKICYGLTLGDFKPPDGIETLHLEDVCIYLDISSLLPISECEETEFLLDDIPQFESLEASPYSSCPCPMLIPSHYDIMSCQRGNMSSMSNALPSFQKDVEAFDGGTSDIMLLETRQSDVIPSSENEGSEWQSYQHMEKYSRGCSPDVLVSLLDTVLRLTIHEGAKIPLDVMITENRFQSRLSEVAPALWSPGFLSALSLRAPLVSTISHSLSGSLYKNVQSTSLKAKLELLSTKSKKNLDLEVPENEDRDAKLHRVRESSLSIWKLLTRELFDAKSGGQLKPVGQAVCTKRRESDCEMLFDVQEHDAGSAALEDGDLLLSGLEECGRSISVLFPSPNGYDAASDRTDMDEA